MKNWITIFPNLKKEHLNKDVGLIPEVMQESFGYKSAILTVNKENEIHKLVDYSIIETNLFLGNIKLGILKYILKNAKSMDVINLYHLSLLETILWILPYKIINPKGKVFLKMDLSTKYMHDYTDNKIMMHLRKLFLKMYDLITVESSVVCDYMNDFYDNRIKLIPNGFYWNKIEPSILLERENEILYVARIGAECKKSEILIEAFEKNMSQHDWILHLVGPMDKNFKKWYESKLNCNPTLRERVIYDGSITDRKKILDIYSKSKIFALCSEYESFGIVLIEALSMGNYLIATDGINSASDIISDNRIGVISKTNDSIDLAEKIINSINNKENFKKENVLYRMKFAESNYSWINICNELYKLLNGETHYANNND